MDDYKGRKDGLEPKNFLEAMESIPAFMTQTPEGELPELVEALQRLKYAEDDPDECAESYKEDGNVNFKKKKYKLAVECYSKALELKMTKLDLKSALFFNRAAANFQLKNYRKCINDCQDAVNIDPGYTKAITKGAEALYALEKYSEALECIERGLKLAPDNQRLLELRSKVEVERKKQLAKSRKEEKERTRISSLRSAIADRGIRLSPPNPWDGDHVAKTPSGCTVVLTSERTLRWPVRLLFPEVNQQEFVEQVEEGTKIRVLLRLFLDENVPEWDVSRAYASKTARCFFLDSTNTIAYEVDTDMELGTVLSFKDYVVENALPSFLVLSFSTEFSKNFLSQYEKVVKIN